MSLPGAVTFGRFFYHHKKSGCQRPSIYQNTYVVNPHHLVVASLRVLVVSRNNKLMASLDRDLNMALISKARPRFYNTDILIIAHEASADLWAFLHNF
jgi:hypothetical protein